MTDPIRVSSFSDPEPNSQPWLWWLAGGCLLLFLCIGCVALAGLSGGYYAYTQFREEQTADATRTETAANMAATSVASRANDTATPQPLPTVAPIEKMPLDTATAVPLPQTPTDATSADVASAIPALNLPVPAQIIQITVPAQAEADLRQFYLTDYPAHDRYETAVRLNGYTGSRTMTAPAYQPGDSQTFLIDTEDGVDETEATLTAVTEHTYFWVEEGLNLNQAELIAAANRFETEFYGPLTNLFGQLWQPGIDNEPHFSVLHISHSASDELGYFRSDDEYPASIAPGSNEQEIIYLNMGELALGEDLYYATLVHEVQHLIQWNVDPGEAAWMNEGLSQLAEIYLGFTDTAETLDYLENPETRLNSWAYDDDLVYAHYAGAYLFLVYIWEQLGETAVQELARHPANDMAGVYAVLQGFVPDLSLEQFTANWAAANYLDNSSDETTGDGRYFYRSLHLQRPSFQNKVTPDEMLDVVDTVEQFGVHYIDLNDLRGPVTVSFAGDTAVPLINANLDPTDKPFWYAPAVDEMNAHLTGLFDLSTVSQATLKFSVWYDLEEDFDYAYVSISADGGQTWEILTPEHSSNGPIGDGYNGRSAAETDAQEDGWLKENISLDAYSGQLIQLRFDVITDSGITEQGFAIKDIAITSPETNIFTTGTENWQAEGFVFTGGWLPQKWSVLWIEEKTAESTNSQVTPLALDGFNRGQWQLEIGKGGGVLMIMPQTPFIEEEARYWLNIAP
jgi:hypothetical protein